MKFEKQVSNIERGGNLGAEGGFTIKATSKAFRILADGLYSDKILAVIRELTCNSIDAHAEIGETSKPIEIHIPNQLEPFFAVKDYGAGLSPDFMKNRYTSLFDSTKTESNLAIGGLGIGRMSAFSYADSFMVVSRFEGVKRAYTVFINEDDLPAITLIDESPTTEASGLEVSLAVTEGDIHSFLQNCRNFFGRGLVNATFNGSTSEQAGIQPVQYSDVQGGNWKIRKQGGAFVIMGAVAYPVREVSAMNLSASEKSLLLCPLDITIGIGDMEVAASREALQMTPKSCVFIKSVLSLITKELQEGVVKEIANASNFWQACATYQKLRSGSLSSVWTAITNSGPMLWNGKDVRIDYIRCSEAEKFTVKLFDWSQYRLRLSCHTERSIPIGDSTRIVWIDDETSVESRIRHYFKQAGVVNNIYAIYPNGVSKDDIIKFLGREGMELVNFSTNFPKPPRKAHSISDKGKAPVLILDGYTGEKSSDNWGIPDAFDIADGGVYIPIESYKPLGCDRNRYAVNMWKALDSLAKTLEISIPVLHGVKKRHVEKFQKAKNWKTLQEFLQDAADKKLKNTSWVNGQTEVAAYRDLSNHNEYIYLVGWLSQCKVNNYALAGDLEKMAEKLAKLSKVKALTTVDMQHLQSQLTMWGCQAPAIKQENTLSEEMEILKKSYPLLRLLDSHGYANVQMSKELAEYSLSKKR